MNEADRKHRGWAGGFRRGLGLACALFFLGACLDDGRPLADYLAELPPDENRPRECEGVNDDPPPTKCSVNGGLAITARFVNERAGEVDVFWVNADCKEAPYGSLNADGTRDQPTYSGQPWRFRDRCTGAVVLDWPGAPLNTAQGSVIEVVIP